MKTYTQDYTKISKAEDELYFAATRMRVFECDEEAIKHINLARTFLQEYTNGTNLVEDDDVEDGLVKRSDAEAAIEEANKKAIIEKKAIEYLHHLSSEAKCESSLTIDSPFGLDCELRIVVKRK